MKLKVKVCLPHLISLLCFIYICSTIVKETELGTFVLDTHNPDCLISIYTVDTFNILINAYSLNFSYTCRVPLPCGILNKEKINLTVNQRSRL